MARSASNNTSNTAEVKNGKGISNMETGQSHSAGSQFSKTPICDVANSLVGRAPDARRRS